MENILVLRHTIERYIFTIDFDTSTYLIYEIYKCFSLSLVLYKSTDIQDKPQLAIFACYVMKDVDVKAELLDLTDLKKTSRSDIDIKVDLDQTFWKAEIPIKKNISISTDGAPSMIGKYWNLSR